MTRQALARLDRNVRSQRPDLVVVRFGINDSWIDVDQGRTRSRLYRSGYRGNLRTIVRRLRRDGARQVLMTPNPMRWSDPYYIKAFTEHPGVLNVNAVSGIDRLLDVYAEDVRDVAKSESVALVDVFEAFERYGKIPGQSMEDILLAGDGIHPNGSGASRDFRPFGVLSPQNYCRDHFRKRCIFHDFATCNRARFLILTRKSEVVSADAPEPG